MNYGDLPKEYSEFENSKIVILPVPYDGTSTWGKGADKGPNAIIEASTHMELYDIETESEVYSNGIFTADPITESSSPESMTEAVKKKVKELVKKNKFVVTLGGEHSISIGAAQAHIENFKNLTILQFDAHSDLRDEYEGSKFNHACVMARLKEDAPIVQVGIRSMDIGELKNMNKKRVFFAENIWNDKMWINKLLTLIAPNVYITIDLDVFDPSIMPATGTPEPGGMLWYEFLRVIKKVIRRKKLVGFDVVELCPNPNHPSSDFLAAKLIYKILSYKFTWGKK